MPPTIMTGGKNTITKLDKGVLFEAYQQYNFETLEITHIKVKQRAES